MNRKYIHSILSIFIVLLFSFLTLMFFSRTVPYENDEFIFYANFFTNSIACINPETNCTGEGIPLLGMSVIPYLSYHYIGPLKALAFSSLFFFVETLLIARILGVIALFLQALLLQKIFQTKVYITFLFLLFFFPYTFQHIVDTGPIIFQTTSIFAITYLLTRWNHKQKIVYPTLIAIIAALGIWDKLIYLYLLPSVGLIGLFYAYSLFKKTGLRIIRQVAIASIVLLILIIFIFLIPKNNQTYFEEEILEGEKSTFSLSESKKHFNQTIFPFIHHPLGAAHRIYFSPLTARAKIKEFPLIDSLYLLIYLIPLFFIIYNRLLKKKALSPFLVINYACFWMTIFLFSTSTAIWSMQHIILAFPFFLNALFSVYNRIKGRTVIITLFLLLFITLNLFYYQQITQLELPTENADDKMDLITFMSKNELHLLYSINFKGWGSDFIYATKNYKTFTFHSNHTKQLYVVYNRRLEKNGIVNNAVTHIPLNWYYRLTRCEAINKSNSWQLYYSPNITVPECDL